MKKLAKNTMLSMQPVPKTLVSCRDKDGKNNALVVGFAANVSLDPAMVMVGIVPTRYSHHMVKESGCFVINLPKKGYEKEYNYLGSASGRDEDKFEKMNIQWKDAEYAQNGLNIGHTSNYINVKIPLKESKVGEFITVKLQKDMI